LRINLQFDAVVGDPLPTDFSFGHLYLVQGSKFQFQTLASRPQSLNLEPGTLNGL
jgi:hypothetical protein